VDIAEDPPDLKLSITKAEFSFIENDPVVSITMRLQNSGVYSTSIPWSSQPVEAVSLGAFSVHDTGYELATIEFSSKTGGKKIVLRGGVALWAQPGNMAQLMKIAPGEWVEFKLRAKPDCLQDEAALCLSQLTKNKFAVTAFWWQRLLTKTVENGCTTEHGAYTQTELFSNTVDVVLPSSTTNQAGPTMPPKAN
jgi:hypothetical protein